jgi:hypothetical protein
VDHFIPWARHPDDGLDNLVVAHRRCNGQKRDFLAAPEHLERWSGRAAAMGAQLDEIGARARWQRAPDRIAGVARAIYLRLPSESRLWVQGQHFVRVDADAVRRALA